MFPKNEGDVGAAWKYLVVVVRYLGRPEPADPFYTPMYIVVVEKADGRQLREAAVLPSNTWTA
jgi:hypothetical protein